jgi:hypothetical protein
LAIGAYAAYAFALEDIDREEDDTGESIGDNPAFGVFASLGFYPHQGEANPLTIWQTSPAQQWAR